MKFANLARRVGRRGVKAVRHIPHKASSTWTTACWASSGAGVPIRSNERRLAALKNREAGKRIFILGNGPSLLRTDVDRLCGEVSIASNGIFLLFDKKRFRPAYYTIEDMLVAEDRRTEAASMTGCKKIFPEDVRKFIPRDENTVYINFIRDYVGFPLFSENCQRAVYWGGTVTFMNLQLAHYLGASDIYLIGFDHYYVAPDHRDRVDGTVITSNTRDNNHFDERYFGPGYRWHDPKVDRMEQGYRAAREFLEARGVRIFNATDGGGLEIFERVSFESLF